MRITFTSVLRATIAVAALAGIARPAHATTLTFENVSATQSCSANDIGAYGGLLFSGFSLVCDSDFAAFGNGYSAPSPDYAVTNASGAKEADISIGAGSFSLIQASFASFASSNQFDPLFSSMSIAVAGYRAGDDLDHPTYSTAFDLLSNDYARPLFVDPATSGPWTGLTTLAFISGAGTVADNFSIDGYSWLMDDLQVDVNGGGPAPVPEPGTLMLVALGLGGIARARAGRRSPR